MKFSDLPQMDKILKENIFLKFDKSVVKLVANDEFCEIRAKLEKNANFDISYEEILKNIALKCEKTHQKITKVINATGIIIHTNLGRSPIGEQIYDDAKSVITGANNIEYDLNSAKRSQRYDYFSVLARELFGCEDAIVVNNNAAAVFLVLNTFANGKNVIVSRGELVEIGGNFRIPEVMSKSGANLSEIGTTNRTNLSDYENAIDENTALLLKVHHSNFCIEGFCKSVQIDEISALAMKNKILSYYDLGSAYVANLPYNLGKNEPNLAKLIKTNVDIVSFSGDKLFGSVQSGIILGKKSCIEKLKKNQLLRMFRVSKITLCMLNLTLSAYLNKDYSQIPVLFLLNRSIDELENTAKKLVNSLNRAKFSIIKTQTFLGGGTMPNKKIPSIAIAFNERAQVIEAKFRRENVIGRIENDKFLLDLRSVLPKDCENLRNIIKRILDE